MTQMLLNQPSSPSNPSLVPAPLSRIVLRTALLTVAIFFFLCLATRAVGLTWDEPFYLRSAQEILSFFGTGDYSDAQLIKHFDASQWRDVHPAFAKELGALTLRLTRSFQNDLIGYRTANLLLSALTIGLIYLFVSLEFNSDLIGLLTALVCATMPRVLGQMLVGTTDITLYCLSFPAAVAAYYSANRASIKWAIVSGIFCGLCLSTRYPGLVVPVAIFVWAFLYHRDKRGSYLLFFVPLLTALVFIFSNPNFWHDPLVRAFLYLSVSSARHTTTPVLGYMFDFFVKTPWYYPAVMIWATLPLFTLILVGLGIYRAFNAGLKKDLAGLFALLTLFPIVLVLMPGNVAYDGVRLFVLSFLYLGLFSAWAFVTFHASLQKPIVSAGMIFLLLLAPVLTHPFYLEYYSPQIGGLWGAARLRLEITYWWDAANANFYKEANIILPASAKVALFPADQLFMDYYRDRKLLNGTIVAPNDSQYMAVLCRPSCTNARLHAFVAKWYKEPDVLLRYPSEKIPFVVLLKREAP